MLVQFHQMRSMKPALAITALAMLASSCTGATEGSTSAQDPSESSEASDDAGQLAETSTTTQLDSPTTSDSRAGSAASAGVITLPDELRVTPRQAEGPFYPVSKPEDRDSNLLVVDGGEPTALGTPLELSGLLLYEDGAPVAGATIEIWQVDGQGIYDHPNAPDTESRDRAFQFYGEAVTDDSGFWSFLTLEPVPYEPRPRHIHAKVKVDGVEVLTTQIYFDGDPLLDRDGLAASAGDDLVLLTTNSVPGTLSNGQQGLVARHLIVLGR